MNCMRSRDKMAESLRRRFSGGCRLEKALGYFEHYHGIDPGFEPKYSRAGWVHMQLADLAAMQGNSGGSSLDIPTMTRPRPNTTESLHARRLWRSLKMM